MWRPVLVVVAATAVACSQDVTTDLAFACHTSAQCAAGWRCEFGICRRGEPDAVTTDTAPADASDALVRDASDRMEVAEIGPMPCLGEGPVSYSWERHVVEGFVLPPDLSDFVLDPAGRVLGVSRGFLRAWEPTTGETTLGPELGRATGITAGTLVSTPEGRSVTWVPFGESASSAHAVIVGLSEPRGIAMATDGTFIGADESGFVFAAPPFPARGDPVKATPIAVGIFAPTLVAEDVDGKYRAIASGPAGTVYSQTRGVSGWGAPSPVASLLNAPLPVAGPTCANEGASCFAANGLVGVCDQLAGERYCRADPTAPDPRLGDPTSSVLCALAPDAACGVDFAGRSLTGTCEVFSQEGFLGLGYWCNLAATEAGAGCEDLEIGAPCVIVSADVPTHGEVEGDSDADGISDARELALGTLPQTSDSDGDGVRDGDEPGWFLDDDGDGDINARDPDSNNDGLEDGLARSAPVPRMGICVDRDRLVEGSLLPHARACAPPTAPQYGRGRIAGLAVSTCGDVLFTEVATLPDAESTLSWVGSDGQTRVTLLSIANGDPPLGPIHWGTGGLFSERILYGIDTATGRLIALTIKAGPTP